MSALHPAKAVPFCLLWVSENFRPVCLASAVPPFPPFCWPWSKQGPPGRHQAWAARFHAMLPWEGWTEGLVDDDFRFAEFRRRIPNKAAFWAFSLSSFHLTPALLVFAGSIPMANLLTAKDLPAVTPLQVPRLASPHLLPVCHACVASPVRTRPLAP